MGIKVIDRFLIAVAYPSTNVLYYGSLSVTSSGLLDGPVYTGCNLYVAPHILLFFHCLGLAVFTPADFAVRSTDMYMHTFF